MAFIFFLAIYRYEASLCITLANNACISDIYTVEPRICEAIGMSYIMLKNVIILTVYDFTRRVRNGLLYYNIEVLDYWVLDFEVLVLKYVLEYYIGTNY